VLVPVGPVSLRRDTSEVVWYTGLMMFASFKGNQKILVPLMVTASLALTTPTGAGAAILHLSWTPTSHAVSETTPNTTTRLTRIAFSSPSDGYGVFTFQGPSTCTDRVGRTSDGGTTFSHLVSVVSWACGNSSPVGNLAFDNRGDGLLYGTKLFVTHNGGVSWSRSEQPGPVLSVEALGHSIWMLEASHPVPSSGNYKIPLRLVSSSNGGRSWSVVSTPRGALILPTLVDQPGSLVRVSQTSAYIAGSPALFPNLSEAKKTPFWFTSDAGATWSYRPIPCSGFATALSAASDGTLFDVCASQPGTGSQVKETLRSSNQGRTWQVMSSCRFSSSNLLHCTPGSQTPGYLGEIDAVSNKTIYLVGDRSSLEVSRDGGVTWSPVAPGLGGEAGGTFQVTFFGPSAGIVLGFGEGNGPGQTGNIVWSTSDGGVQWTTRHPVITRY